MDFSSIFKSFTKVKAVRIDNFFFRFHYKWTVAFLSVCFIVTATSQYLGQPIFCTREHIESPAVNAYCWNGGYAYWILNPEPMWAVAEDMSPQSLITRNSNHEVRYISLHRWLPWIVALHAVAFSLTHIFWKFREGDCLSKMLCLDMKSSNMEQWCERRLSIIRRVSNARGTHRGYGWAYLLCEGLNFLSAIGNVWAMDQYLNVHFYGLRIIGLLPKRAILTVGQSLWPAVAKCSFYEYGPSGSIINFDYICVLGYSYFYHVMTTVIWFWMAFAALISLLNLVVRFFTLVSVKVKAIFVHKLAPSCEKEIILDLLAQEGFGGYLIYVGVGEALSQEEFQQVLLGVYKRVVITPP